MDQKLDFQKKQIIFLDTIYEGQSEWTVGSNINEINDNLRKIVINPNDELSFFEGAVVGMLDQRYCEFFRSRFNTDIDEIVRIDILEIIKSHLPAIRKKIS